MSNLKGVFWVPGLPHVLHASERNAKYGELKRAMQKISEEITAINPKKIIFHSTQWLSVLATSVQTRKHLKGVHVDENWYELGDLPYAFTIDQKFAQDLTKNITEAGLPAQAIDYNGFPVDTGTIVAQTLLNPRNIPCTMVSSHVYLDHDKMLSLGQTVRKSIEASGESTVVIVVSGLSGHYFTQTIDLREDRIREPADDERNHKMLGYLVEGNYAKVRAHMGDYARDARADMGFKAMSWADGVINTNHPAEVRAYGPIYGTGNAVLRLF